GTVCERDLILNFADRYRGVLIIDEAYIEFSDDAAHQSFIAEAVRRPNVIVLRTLSKAWAAAGLRVGCIIAHEDIIRIMRALKPPYSITWPSELLAAHILETKVDQTKKAVLEVKRQRESLNALLHKCRHVSFVSRSQANFVFFVTPKAETLERVFNESGFLIRRYHGARMANAVRISMPPASEFEQIQDILSQNLN
ncbi:MAG: histidinol-phosphate transaminase, partial [Pseudomonadota bacterium]